jgi:tetraacyldisaccharide 4'-kinase
MSKTVSGPPLGGVREIGAAIRAGVARALEAGAYRGRVSSLVSEVWEHLASSRIARPLTLPGGLRVIAIGGATLGGAGKTPTAVALARALGRAALVTADRSSRVVLVSHAYRARPGFARVVRVDDEVTIVGDDALASARALAADGIEVVVAPTREAAVRFAATRADIAIVDGLLQTSPRRVDDAVLVLDGAAPWGSGRCPPAGDLRAGREVLLAAADHVVSLGAAASGATLLPTSVSRAVSSSGDDVPLVELREREVGVVLAIAHPERVLQSLAAQAIHPRTVVSLADHAGFDLARLGAHRVEVWLTTSRCATKLPTSIGALVARLLART